MMESIYHLVLRSAWERPSEADYRADSLAQEGFLHCSFEHQVAWAANRFYAEAEDLLVLKIDPARLRSAWKVEPPLGKADTDEVFPHIYAPLNRDAVVAVRPMQRGQDGRWLFVP